MLLQDIKRCTGPQSKLTQLNADVKKNFHNLRLRIQVRSYISANAGAAAELCISNQQFTRASLTSCVLQDLEQMAMEQDKESNKQALLSQVEGHRKQMLR